MTCKSKCSKSVINVKQHFTIIFFREKGRVKPRLFKIWDHQTDQAIVDKSAQTAAAQKVDLKNPEVRARFLKHYNRARLALAGKANVFQQWETITAKTEPAENDLFSNWLNALAMKSMAIQNELLLDFKRPLVIHMMLAPNSFL